MRRRPTFCDSRQRRAGGLWRVDAGDPAAIKMGSSHSTPPSLLTRRHIEQRDAAPLDPNCGAAVPAYSRTSLAMTSSRQG